MREKAARLIFHHNCKAALAFGFGMATDFNLSTKLDMMRVSGWLFHYSLFPLFSYQPTPGVVIPPFKCVSTSVDGSLCNTDRHPSAKFFSENQISYGSKIFPI